MKEKVYPMELEQMEGLPIFMSLGMKTKRRNDKFVQNIHLR